jgi:hypothetical protein
LRGAEPKGRWILTFLFGLIHGCGFASALRELGVGANGGSIVLALLSFNLGVEAGQLAIASILLPLLWRLGSQRLLVTRLVPIGSTLVMLLGCFWLIQRVFT